MNIQEIFNLFTNNPEMEEEKKKELEEFKNKLEQKKNKIEKFLKTPHSKISLFNKMILNYQVFHNSLSGYLKEIGGKRNPDDIKKVSQSYLFEKSWEYIRDININKKTHVNAIKKFNPVLFNSCLDLSIRYFESIESYEKCHHLLQIKNILKNV